MITTTLCSLNRHALKFTYTTNPLVNYKWKNSKYSANQTQIRWKNLKKSALPLVMSLLVSVVVGVPAFASPTTLHVNPPSIVDLTMVPPAQFSVDVTIKEVTDLYGFEFMLNYTTEVLTVTEITSGPFFPPQPWIVGKVINDAAGYVRYMVTLPLGTDSGVDGSGTLATIDFTVEGHGSSKLDLCSTIITNTWGQQMPHDVYDGYFSNERQPKVYVEPESIVDPDLVPGENFTINVNVLNASDLHNFEFKLNYDTTLLDANVTEGGFLKSSGLTNFTLNINETLGFVWVNVTLLDPLVGVTGDGTLAMITFSVTAIGECILDLYETKLVDSMGRLVEHYAPIDGYFKNKPIIHDVAITKVTTTQLVKEDNTTYAIEVGDVRAGENVNITVLVRNNGTEPESFTVTAYYDNTTIKTETLSAFPPDTSITLTFDWNTEGVAVGSYTISAEASVVAGENDMANNKCIKEGTFEVLAKGQLVPMELAVAAVILAIAAAAIALYFLKIRKPKPA